MYTLFFLVYAISTTQTSNNDFQVKSLGESNKQN